MNQVQLVGNLTRDPELRQTNSGISMLRFTVAVNRRRKSADGTQKTDFIDCVAWRQTAEFIARYFKKGQRIGICGSLHTDQYDDRSGERRYRTEVQCEDVEFVTSKAQSPGGGYESDSYESRRSSDDGYGGYGDGGRSGSSSYGGRGQDNMRSAPPADDLPPDSRFQDDTPDDPPFAPISGSAVPDRRESMPDDDQSVRDNAESMELVDPLPEEDLPF